MSEISSRTFDSIKKFIDDRHWSQFHSPKDLAISISLEASELLEIFQWSGTDVDVAEKRVAMKEELADILIYSIIFGEKLGFDFNQIIENKIRLNAEKYPVQESLGNARKYTELKD